MITTVSPTNGIFGGVQTALPPTLGSNRFDGRIAGAGDRRNQVQRQQLRDVSKTQRTFRQLQVAEQKAFSNRTALQCAPRAVALLASLGGSGVAVSAGTQLLTAAHVVGNMRLGATCLATFERLPIRATLSAVHKGEDLALFRLATAAPFSLAVANADHLPAACRVLGFAGLRSPVANMPAPVCDRVDGTIWADAPVQKGMSGGPLIDGATGELVGLVSCGVGNICQFAALDSIRSFLGLD